MPRKKKDTVGFSEERDALWEERVTLRIQVCATRRMILPVTDGATVGRPGFGRNIRTLVQGTLSEIDLLNTK